MTGSEWTSVVLATTAKVPLEQNHYVVGGISANQSHGAPAARMDALSCPGVWVYDFEQNEPGWCKLQMPECPRGLVVQLRHAEVLQHPPYGPEDGSIYVANLRSAKATDIYVCKGDPAGESIEFSFTQHGFRYVELTFPGAKSGSIVPPTLETLTAIMTRSSVDLTGDLVFGDEMLQKVHHNYLWGQASNLMMVPSDCDNRDERFGWTGDSALTADEASVNFDLSSFYDNWARMWTIRAKMALSLVGFLVALDILAHQLAVAAIHHGARPFRQLCMRSTSGMVTQWAH